MNGLKTEFPDELVVIHIDVQSPAGREFAREYGSFTPTFVLFDENGEEVWQSVGRLARDEVRYHFDNP